METNYSKEFGRRLQTLIKEQGITIQECSEDLCCSSISIRYWIKGRVPFIVHILKRLYDEGVDLNELVGGEKLKRKGNTK